MTKDNSICTISFGQMDIKDYDAPDDFIEKCKDYPKHSLEIHGINMEETIYIQLIKPDQKSTDDVFFMQITFDVAKQMIRAMQTIINEYDQKGK